MDAAVQKAYGGKRKIHWMEVYAGEKSNKQFNTWLPDETVAACRDYLVSIKGPLTTPVGGGIRSLNVALRQMLDLYVCLRPVRWFKGVPSPVKHPEKVDMVIFRENTEDIYAGIEFEAGTEENKQFLELFKQSFPKAYAKIRFPDTSGIGIKPVSKEGSERLIRSAHRVRDREQAQEPDPGSQGQHPEVHRRRVPQLGLPARRARVRRAHLHLGAVGAHQGGPGREGRQRARWMRRKNAGKVIVKDAIADIALQQVLTRSDEFDVIATLNLNGDYLSDALAAQVGGIGIAPGGNINYLTGHAVFEATHGTAPKYANLDKVNPGSVILSGRDDAALHGLARGRRRHHQRHGPHHRTEDRDLRLRADDGRREGSLHQRLRRCSDQQPIIGGSPARAKAAAPAPMNILEWARKVQAIAQNGLALHPRSLRSRALSSSCSSWSRPILQPSSTSPQASRGRSWHDDEGYATPKVDVRGGVFDQDNVLLVRERSDGKWTLPGGWVDVGDGPSFAVEREIREESGYLAKAVKLAALVDKSNPIHGHPPGIHHIYKLLFVCELTGRQRRRPAMRPTASISFRALAAAPVHWTRHAVADRAAVSSII